MRLRELWIAGLIGIAALGAAAQNAAIAPAAIAGEWSGSIAGTLPLVLHVRADASGTLTATMDSPTQGANGLLAANVKLSGATFSFEVPLAKGSFTGTVSADGKSIAGTWTQGQAEPLEWKQTKTAAQVAAETASIKPSPIDGDWTGALSAGGQTLHLVFHFHAGADGAIHGNLDSVDQNAMGIPCGAIKVDDRKVTVEVPAVNGHYSGTLAADGKHIDGTWSQGTPLELDLTRK